VIASAAGWLVLAFSLLSKKITAAGVALAAVRLMPLFVAGLVIHDFTRLVTSTLRNVLPWLTANVVSTPADTVGGALKVAVYSPQAPVTWARSTEPATPIRFT
jgi:hypothetical protein